MIGRSMSRTLNVLDAARDNIRDLVDELAELADDLAATEPQRAAELRSTAHHLLASVSAVVLTRSRLAAS